MMEAREYLALLSKVMRENKAADGFERKSYDSLYTVIHSELNAQLKASFYPEAPWLTQRLNHMLDAMEPLFLCSEMVGTACLLLSGYRTNELFSMLGGVFLNAHFAAWLSGIPTQLPFVVVHGDVDSIEVLNHADQRVPLSPAEFRLLITGSGKSRVALNKIVQVFIIQTPLKRRDACLIFDNVYQTARRIFGRAVCREVVYVDRGGLENARKHGLPCFDAITCEAGLEGEAAEISALNGCPLIKKDDLADYLDDRVSPILYGFRDEFRALEIRIESYYLKAVQQARASAQEIVGDIVRLGAGADQTLSSIRSASQAKADAFESEQRKIHDILVRTKACVLQAEAALRDTISSEKAVPRRVYEDVFSGLFDAGRNCARFGQEILSRLTALGYDKCELAAAYIQSASGQKAHIACVPVKEGEWEKAKMYLEIADPDCLSSELLRNYFGAIGTSRLVTGKEYYARSLIASGADKTAALKESFDRGYEPAGEALLERYKKGDRQVNLQTLSNALVPDACMMTADQQGTKNRGRQFANLSDQKFTYYKIAAAREHLPAIGMIVDTIFQSRFAQAYQLHGDQFQDPKFQDMIENGQALCQLCRFLIDRMYQVRHFSEILGVVLFCLNENLSEAMTLLSGIDSGVANYCKGNLYEFGGGVAVDLDQAVLHYQQALDQGFPSKQLEKRLAACQGKRRQKAAQERAGSYYHVEKSYQPTISNRTSSSSGLCVITSAACQTLHAADDCEELRLLRWFRDTHLQDTAEGEAIVREYYRVGPLITDSIGKTQDPEGRYRCLWERYIAPSCAAIRAERWDTARSIYIQMVKMLCEEFGIDIRPRIRALLEDL